MSVDTEKLVDIQPKEKKPRATRKPKVEPAPAAAPLKRPKLVKGSQEAKDYMASLRNMKKNKQVKQ